MDERIVSAAVRHGELIFSLPAPARHCHVIYQMARADVGSAVFVGEQGFLTSAGRYLGRLDAAELARQAGQVTAADVPPGRELFSEDVW